jgi:DivIVA domain-containing protein
MADELTPDRVRARRFDVVRKGYERGQVEQFLESLGAEIERLGDELTASADPGALVGIDEQEALARELHTIGGEVSEILEAARAAAEGLRSRASQDADDWRSAAESESTQTLDDATEQSQSMRASAWNEGSSLLSSAAAEAQAIVATAKEDSLFVRAEAEREAIRLTGDARRDREEMLRAARAESEQIIEASRTESEGVLAAAAQQAELAQERARALEDRRSELLGELEAARDSIGELESEIESKRQELDVPEEVLEVPAEPVEGLTHHASDSGSVKIVSPTRAVELEPVDAEEFVAEVEALRAGDVIRAPAQPTPTPDLSVTVIEDADLVSEAQAASHPSSESQSVPASDESPTESEDVIAAPIEVAEVDQTTVVAHTSQPQEDDGPDTDDTVEVIPSAIVEEIQDEPADEEVLAVEPDDLGSLFAQLRDSTTEQPVVEAQPPSEEKPSAATDVASDPAGDEPPTDGTPLPDETSPRVESTTDGGTGAHSEQAARLIPLQNAALRSIKRTLVDLQNEALEHLRTDNSWVPDEEFTDRFDEAFIELTAGISGQPDSTASDVFSTDLYDAVFSAIERTRASGGGDREVAASASKVFRTWRSDEAERRVVEIATAQTTSA